MSALGTVLMAVITVLSGASVLGGALFIFPLLALLLVLSGYGVWFGWLKWSVERRMRRALPAVRWQ